MKAKKRLFSATCVACSRPFEREAWSRPRACSSKCVATLTRRGTRAKLAQVVACLVCGVEFCPIGCEPRKTCSVRCYRAGLSKTMSRTNRQQASARMKKRNPMRLETARSKLSATLKRIGHAPAKQGGIGRGPTKYERMVAESLGLDMDLVVSTDMPRGRGYPVCYRIDVGDRELKLAIEVDGRSHGLLKRQELDRKKDAFLTERGWTVLRVKHRDLEERPESSLSKLRDAVCALRHKVAVRTKRTA